MTTVAGLVPFTSIDFPGHLAAVVFFQGCPLKCPFCHNPDLQKTEGQGTMTWTDILDFLSKRQGKLDGIVLSGGEPLMQPQIVAWTKDVKKMGFKVGLHTSGVYPARLKELLPLTDWVGLDIKAPWDKYDILSGRPHIAEKVQESLRLLLANGGDFEARTTCDPTYLKPTDILNIVQELKKTGVKTYAMQHYRTYPEDKNPPELSAINAFFTPEILSAVKQFYPQVIIR